MKLCWIFLLSVLISSSTVTAFVSGNPFDEAVLYVNPTYWNEVQNAISVLPTFSSLFAQVQNVSTANWLDTTAKTGNITKILADALNQAGNSDIVVPFVVYNLPDRDCSAGASNGEILCADANCTAGIAQYQTQYIDVIVQAFEQYPNENLRIVAIIEPDALPNMATNLAIPKCAQGEIAYFSCISYAISQFGTLGNVWVYLDAAHGGWLGWDGSRAAYISVVNTTLYLAGGNDLIRGFATNTANYQPLGSNTSTYDPCNLTVNYNPSFDEVHYVKFLDETANAAGITGKGYIIDTSRNGVPDSRANCNDWCNVKSAGFGVFSTANTAQAKLPIIDAFYWVKTPGESDGTSDTSSPRYDPTCTSVDASTPAPEAGLWWPQYFLTLAENSPFVNQLTKVGSGACAVQVSMVLVVSITIFTILFAA